jgi:ceramide glucosyltransferase
MAARSSLAFLRTALVAATAASIGYQVAAMLAARRWQRRAPEAEGRGRCQRSGNAPAAMSELTPDPHPLTPVAERLPPVSILKPIRGLEPHAEASFASFCTQEYPEYELLFGTADPNDPAVEAVRRLAERYPAAHVRLIQTSAELGPNRKVCNLHGLAAAARHDLLLVSDSDMRVAPDYLRRVVVPFHDPRVGLVTCPYRGAEPESLPAALEALGIAASFMPGVFVAALGVSPFASGSTIALRRETLERIGGFAGLVDYLADDFQMGQRVADLGLSVHLSAVVVDSVLGHRAFLETWSRRLRWARTVRACRPLGHVGSGVTHTTALALLTALVYAWGGSGANCESAKEQRGNTLPRRGGLGACPAPTPCPPPPILGEGGLRSNLAPTTQPSGREESSEAHRPSSPSPSIGGGGQGVGAGMGASVRALITTALLVRMLVAWRIAVVELESDAARRWFPLLPISDLLETALWVASLFGRTVLWRGQRYRLREGGRIERL